MASDRANRAPAIISRGRGEALSAGVFAIVVTLLGWEITVPHLAEHESMAELARLSHVGPLKGEAETPR